MIAIAVLVASALMLVDADFYSSKYDDFDVQPIIENDRIMQNYAKCFIDQGACTPDAKDFKKVIPETLETSCGKCTDKQKLMIRKVIKALKEKHPEAWEQIIDKFDKDNRYRETFDKFVNEND